MNEYLYDKITLEELILSETKITKRIVVINSSQYTDEAFDYLLSLVDENESIAFISDQKQIYTLGTWYGGDLWEDKLKFFSKIILNNEYKNIINTINASDANDIIEIKGENGIELYSDYDMLKDVNVMHLKYDISQALNNEVLNLNSNKIVLKNENGKITLSNVNENAITINELNILEYDTNINNISLNINVEDNEKLKYLKVFNENNEEQEYVNVSNIIIPIQINENLKLIILYEYDNQIDTKQLEQKWGYGWTYGITIITEQNFIDENKQIENDFVEKTIEIYQPLGEYAWFAYPSKYELNFIDCDSGLVGGWQKMHKFKMYSKNIEYQTYRTTNAGLGKIKWKITKK